MNRADSSRPHTEVRVVTGTANRLAGRERRHRQGVSLRMHNRRSAGLSATSAGQAMRVGRGGVMRAGVLAVLVLLGCSLQAIGQSAARLSVEGPSRESGRPVAAALATSGSPVAPDGELQLVVALFRHGVRAPLPGFAARANDHSGQKWPPYPSDWGAKNWGDLTKRGQVLATKLGSYYAGWYNKNAWPAGFNVFLWTDTDQRTIDTAEALADGFRKGIPKPNVTVALMPINLLPAITVDPLFHPFKAGCGTPDSGKLNEIAKDINDKWRSWLNTYKTQFDQLYAVLACPGFGCVPLNQVNDTATAWRNGEERGSSPIKWTGQSKYIGRFPYASSASEAFLLEFSAKTDMAI